MEIFSSLAAYGLTKDLLQVLIVGGVFLVLIGMYWQFFAIGAIGIFIVMAFAGPVETTAKPNVWAENKIRQIDDARKKDFIRDCVHYGDSQSKCESIWNNQEKE